MGIEEIKKEIFLLPRAHNWFYIDKNHFIYLNAPKDYFTNRLQITIFFLHANLFFFSFFLNFHVIFLFWAPKKNVFFYSKKKAEHLSM